MSDWSSDVCSSDLVNELLKGQHRPVGGQRQPRFRANLVYDLANHVDLGAQPPTIGPGLGRTVLGERDTGTLRPCELLVVLQESQGHVRHRLMRPIILRNVPQKSRIAVDRKSTRLNSSH